MDDSFYLRSPRTLVVEYSDCCCNQISSGEGESLELRGTAMKTLKKWWIHFGGFLE